MADMNDKQYEVTPKEAAIAIEEFLYDCGYNLGDLVFSERVGLVIARYDFSERIFTASL